MRTFESGSTRDSDENKPDYEGFLSPLAIERFGEYMHRHRLQADGYLRASDNWQRGIPREAYMKSMWRHFFAVWKGYREGSATAEDLCALLFNVQGMLHEEIKAKNLRAAQIVEKQQAIYGESIISHPEVVAAHEEETAKIRAAIDFAYNYPPLCPCGAKDGEEHKKWCGRNAE